MRERANGHARVTNVELFFDLVYVFAVTQLSHYLLRHLSLAGALQAALLLAMVWLLWAYTTWVTNWLDPERIPVRLLLLGLMLAALTMAAALPLAFADAGLIIGLAYAVMQVGRSLFAVWALRGQPLAVNFERILAWCCVSGALAIAGGLTASVPVRALLWLLAVGVDVLGGLAGFYTPGLGRSSTREWNIEGSHFAERCQAFILIALGESVVVIGATLAGLLGPTGALSAAHSDRPATIGAFIVAFAGSAALWWVYFDRSAEEGARRIAESDDPGRLGRSATISSTRSWWPASLSWPPRTRRFLPARTQSAPGRLRGWSSAAPACSLPGIWRSSGSSGAGFRCSGPERSSCSRSWGCWRRWPPRSSWLPAQPPSSSRW